MMDQLKKIKAYIPEPGLLTLTLITVQIIYYFMFSRNGLDGYSGDMISILSMIFGIITLFLLSSFLESLLVTKTLRRILIPLFIFDIWAHNAYQLSSEAPLDYSMVKSNIGISFSKEAFSMISSPFGDADIVILVIMLAITAFIEYKLLNNNLERRGIKPAVASLLIYLVMVIIPVNAGDGFTLFAKSIFTVPANPAYAKAQSTDYPYYKKNLPVTDFNSAAPDSKRNKPNVFIIMIESFNANFVETKAQDGTDYTPNFNAMIGRGLYIDRFYGNSVQTCKGQAAVFFSILPSMNGKLFVDNPNLHIIGFPAILKGAGYETIFFQAFHSLLFDNTKHNMIKAGFTAVKTYADYRKKEDKKNIWGWGVEDGIFYERFFESLDSIHAKDPAKPLFAALATVGTHIPCDGMPVEKRTVYKTPQNIKEKYINALRLSDSQLPRFFELMAKRKYLENSIVIITADHSFPMKEHGIYNNEVCFYDETFRIPFLVIWDGVIKPERIKDRAYSQVDIGPTVCDLLGIRESDNNMIGISVFDRKSDHQVYLIQPYNGKFLQVVDFPLKYITHLKTGKEYLFNLQTDPGEKDNLIKKGFDSKKVSELKQRINAIYLNQQLIDANKIMRE